jgi:hypothetical protein
MVNPKRLRQLQRLLLVMWEITRLGLVSLQFSLKALKGKLKLSGVVQLCDSPAAERDCLSLLDGSFFE